MMKTKTFDCVEMKRAGARALMEKLSGMTQEEQMAYWEAESRRFREEIEQAKADTTPETTEEFMAKLEALVEEFEKEQRGA